VADGLAANGRQPVGFCCDGHWSIVAMLGILKTGTRSPCAGARQHTECCFRTQAIPTCRWTRDILRTASSSWLQMRWSTALSPHRPLPLTPTVPLRPGGMPQVSHPSPVRD
jgi:hypothetical protein